MRPHGACDPSRPRARRPPRDDRGAVRAADAPPLVAAPLLRIRRRRASAQIVHLAVIGAIRIEEGHAPGEPALRLMDAGAAAGDIDRRSVELLFPSGTAGDLRIVSRASRALAPRAGWMASCSV